MLKEYAFPKIEENISSLLKSSLSDLGIYEFPPIIIEIPKEKSHGDLSTNIAFRLSSILKKKPQQIAEDIVAKLWENLPKFKLFNTIGEIKIASRGFINFFLRERFLHKMLIQLLDSRKPLAGMNMGRGKKTHIEFVSANPTGPLSVAHGRQAAAGDALARILQALGFEVTREYYNNDTGNQIDILGKSLELRHRQLQAERVRFPADYYQGTYLIDLAKQITSEKIKLNSANDYSNFALQKITEIINKELDDFGVKFDIWYSQRQLHSSGKIEKAIELLKKKGYIYKKDKAVWFKSSEFGDDKDRVVIKSDKSYTYLAPDIAYHLDKFERGYKWLINIWGPDHHGYVQRIKGVIQALGYDKQSLSIIIVQLATIYRGGKAIPMSTRKGEYITLREVIKEVGRDAARFFFLMRRTDSHLDFDLELAKKQSPENPVYYIQYAHARICSIINKAKGLNQNFNKLKWDLLKEEEEKQLMRLVFQFSYIIYICFKQLDPYPLTAYLQELATAFHRFYDKHKVLGDNQQLSLVRLGLIRCLQIVFAYGLDLLGLSKPQSM